MSIKRRLSAMECKPAGGAVAEHAETLARLLGTVDSIFWPCRSFENAIQVVRVRRRYLGAGLNWKSDSGGGSSRAWKTDQRQREAMEAAGVIRLIKTKSNLPLVKIVPQAEHEIRELTGAMPLGKLSAGIIRIGLEADPDRAGGWISESA